MAPRDMKGIAVRAATYEALRTYAFVNRRTMTDVMDQALTEYLEHSKNQEEAKRADESGE